MNIRLASTTCHSKFINSLSVSRVVYWAKNGGLAVLDQGLFSGANFLLNILLARWLEPIQYGAFTVAFSVFWLLTTFHNAVLTEPMMVFGPGKYAERFNKYLGIMIYGHLILAIPAALFLLAASLIAGYFYSKDLETALLGSAIAAPLVLLLWVVREAFYVRLQPGRAALGGAFYFLLSIGAVYLMHLTDKLSQTTAFVAMGLSALLVSLLFTNFLKPRWTPGGSLTPAAVFEDHWRYGKWALATAGLAWIPGNVYFVILPAWIGLDGVAGFRSLSNLVMPAIQTINALSLLFLPLLSRHLSQSADKAAATTKYFLALFSAGSVLYLVVLVIFRSEALRLLYGDKYLDLSSLVFIVALLPLGASLTCVMGNVLRVMERPDYIFWCSLFSSAVAVAGGVLLAGAYGIRGALLGMVLSSLTKVITMLVFYNRLSRRRRVEGELKPG